MSCGDRFLGYGVSPSYVAAKVCVGFCFASAADAKHIFGLERILGDLFQLMDIAIWRESFAAAHPKACCFLLF